MSVLGLSEAYRGTRDDSYTLVYENAGPWVARNGRSCRLMAVNALGETRWGVRPQSQNDSDCEAVAHFDLAPWQESGLLDRRGVGNRRGAARRRGQRRAGARGESERRIYERRDRERRTVERRHASRREGNRRRNDALEPMATPQGWRGRQPEDRRRRDRRRGASRFSFEQTTRAEDGFEIVAPRGDLDFNGADDLRALLLDLIARRRDVLVELSAVPYIDSSGVACLVESFEAAKGNGVKFALIGVAGTVERVLRVAHLDKVFPIHATAAQAIAARP